MPTLRVLERRLTGGAPASQPDVRWLWQARCSRRFVRARTTRCLPYRAVEMSLDVTPNAGSRARRCGDLIASIRRHRPLICADNRRVRSALLAYRNRDTDQADRCYSTRFVELAREGDGTACRSMQDRISPRSSDSGDAPGPDIASVRHSPGPGRTIWRGPRSFIVTPFSSGSVAAVSAVRPDCSVRTASLSSVGSTSSTEHRVSRPRR